MPRVLPSNQAFIVEDPSPLEEFAGFPHVIVPLPLDDLRSYAGFSLLLPATEKPRPDGAPTPAEPEAAL